VGYDVAIVVRQLRESDDRSTFRSGHVDLDLFFQRYAGQNQFKLHIGTTYIAIDGTAIVGFATVASCSVEIVHVPKKLRKRLPSYPIPALRLARMAVSKGLQRSGIGALLMKKVFQIAHQQARKTGCAFVVVDAKPGAETYYERWGFEAVPTEAGELASKPTPKPMFLELGAIPKTDSGLLDE
jgi:GNAT superfamily N-acetyltransferase